MVKSLCFYLEILIVCRKSSLYIQSSLILVTFRNRGWPAGPTKCLKVCPKNFPTLSFYFKQSSWRWAIWVTVATLSVKPLTRIYLELKIKLVLLFRAPHFLLEFEQEKKTCCDISVCSLVGTKCFSKLLSYVGIIITYRNYSILSSKLGAGQRRLWPAARKDKMLASLFCKNYSQFNNITR